MSEETKKIEKKAEQVEHSAEEVTTAELSERSLDEAAGGASTGGYLKATSRMY